MWKLALGMAGPLRLVLAPVWMIVKGFLTTNGFLATILIGGGALLYTYDKSRVEAGRKQEAAERTKRNENAVNLANRGAAGAGGKRLLDPYAVTE